MLFFLVLTVAILVSKTELSQTGQRTGKSEEGNEECVSVNRLLKTSLEEGKFCPLSARYFH